MTEQATTVPAGAEDAQPQAIDFGITCYREECGNRFPFDGYPYFAEFNAAAARHMWTYADGEWACPEHAGESSWSAPWDGTPRLADDQVKRIHDDWQTWVPPEEPEEPGTSGEWADAAVAAGNDGPAPETRMDLPAIRDAGAETQVTFWGNPEPPAAPPSLLARLFGGRR